MACRSVSERCRLPRSLRPLRASPASPSRRYWPAQRRAVRKGDAPVAGHAGQRDPLFQGGAEELEPLEGQGTLGLREAV